MSWFVHLSGGVYVNPVHVAMVRPHSQPGWVAVMFPNGSHELVAGTVGEVLALLDGETAVTP